MNTTDRGRLDGYARMAFGIALALVFSACGGGGGGGGGNDIGVGLTAAGSATTVVPGATLTFKANVTNTTSNMEVTWALTGPNCPSNCGTITRTAVDWADYKAPSPVATAFQVTVTATSIEDPSKSGTYQLTVSACPANSGMLSGQYAFLLQGFEQTTANGIAAIGSFTADGCGNVASGATDYFLGTQPGASTFTGATYAMGADQRGTIRMPIGTTTMNFAIALGKLSGGVAAKGALTEIDPAATGGPVFSGAMWRQDPAAFTLGSLANSFAYVLNGWSGAPTMRTGIGGTVSLDGSGNFTSGRQDRKAFNTAATTGQTWSATFTNFSTSTGRIGLPTSAFASVNSADVVAYVVSSGHLLVIGSGTTGQVLSGQMLAQTGPFSLGSLNGSYVSYQTANQSLGGSNSTMTTVLGVGSADGNGHLTFSVDQNNGGSNSQTTGITGWTYAVDQYGHATITAPGPVDGGRWYLTGPDTGLMLGFDAGVSIGAIAPQASGTFSNASVNGTYFATQAAGAGLFSSNGSGVGVSSGNGSLATTMDVNTNGVFATGQTSSPTLNIGTNGRGTDNSGNPIYVVSPTRFLTMSSATSYPVILDFEQ
jgi:hypothetical protein